MKNVCAFGVSLVCLAGSAGSVLAEGPATDTGFGQALNQVAVDGTLSGEDGIAFEEMPSYRELVVSVDSGIVRVLEEEAGVDARAPQEAIWSQVIEGNDADWVRIRFADVVLARSTEQVRESYIRVTSLEDGYEQYLDARTIHEWKNTSAYFNGGSVLVELMASPNVSSQHNRIRIVGVQASDPVSQRSICFSVDDRELSFDSRDARLMPIGCSAWLFGDQGSCFMTASHCSPGGGDVIQFNVPLSSNGGGYRSPPPQDQYIVDGASVQASSSIFIGNDWAYFGTFDNSTTGLTPLQAQGDSHNLAASLPPVDGRDIRITGYGSTGAGVPASWNGVQKTHVGPLWSINGNTVRYRTDTTGGNSGSSILDDTTNTVIGIHTNAGCGSTGGSNQGTSLFNSGLQAALANPQGICVPRTIEAALLFEPTHIDPSGGDVVTLFIEDYHGQALDGNPTMFVDTGNGFVASSMVNSGNDTFEGEFGAIECGTEIAYYFSTTDLEGTVINVPASGVFNTVALDELTIAFEDDFETNMSWSTSNIGASSGDWIRTIPADHNLGDPASDADGSDKCFVTANNNGVDVDGGSVRLVMPFTDTSSLVEPTLRVSLWMVGDSEDEMKVEFSQNAGISWVEVDSISSTDGWVEMNYPITDFVDPSLVFMARFTVSDNGADSLVEGGVDGVEVVSEICETGCPADITGDGELNFFDISEFLGLFGEEDPAADFTGDGSFNFFDISAFLSAFGAGCP
jgi:hypothetical protein